MDNTVLLNTASFLSDMYHTVTTKRLMKGNYDVEDVSSFDANIRSLVMAINRFPGVTTVESCGGHVIPESGQEPEGQWFVTFVIDRGEAAWFSLEFLACVLNNNFSR